MMLLVHSRVKRGERSMIEAGMEGVRREEERGGWLEEKRNEGKEGDTRKRICTIVQTRGSNQGAGRRAKER